MKQAVYALFDRSEAGRLTVADLEKAGFQPAELSLRVDEGGSLDELSDILKGEGVAGDEAPIYAQSLKQGGAFLTIRLDQGQETTAFEILRRNKVTSVKKYSSDRNADADELSEADGWDDFNSRANEHSPDEAAESMWTDRNGNTR